MNIIRDLTEPKYRAKIYFVGSFTLPGFFYLYQLNPSIIIDNNILTIIPLLIIYSIPQYYLLKIAFIRDLLEDKSLRNGESLILKMSLYQELKEIISSRIKIIVEISKRFANGEKDNLSRTLEEINYLDVNTMNEDIYDLSLKYLDLDMELQNNHQLYLESNSANNEQLLLALLIFCGFQAKVYTSFLVQIGINTPLYILYGVSLLFTIVIIKISNKSSVKK